MPSWSRIRPSRWPPSRIQVSSSPRLEATARSAGSVGGRPAERRLQVGARARCECPGRSSPLRPRSCRADTGADDLFGARRIPSGATLSSGRLRQLPQCTRLIHLPTSRTRRRVQHTGIERHRPRAFGCLAGDQSLSPPLAMTAPRAYLSCACSTLSAFSAAQQPRQMSGRQPQQHHGRLRESLTGQESDTFLLADHSSYRR
jgi:hypothetical protein